jgi:1-acyl-sn-glycerol-3-phosphate acyltransferase
MIEARKSRWFERVFAVYNRNLLRRRFAAFCAAGLERLRDRPQDAPLLLYANHSSWWDGLAAFQIGRACGLDHFVMMEERNLRQYPLFRRLGAFSVARGEARESISYAANLLRDTPRALWIFPQGDTLPNDARPFRFYSGAARLARRTGRLYAAPVALRYEFLEEFKPVAFARVGALELVEPQQITPKRLTVRWAAALTATLDALRRDITENNLREYRDIIA